MDELFDTTDLRHSAALRRHTVAADVQGQGDLFAEPTAVEPVAAESVGEPFAWPEPVGALFARADVAGEMMLG